jgi:hypothetical protein
MGIEFFFMGLWLEFYIIFSEEGPGGKKKDRC